jgi:hypothetical protein
MTHAALEANVPHRLPPVRQTLRVVRKAELDVREQVDALEEHVGRADEQARESARELVLSSTLPLELTLFAACLGEMAAERGFTIYAELDAARQEVWDELRRRMRAPRLGALLEEHLPKLIELSGLEPQQLESLGAEAVAPLPTLIRQARAILAACPIERIERAADVSELPEHGHRCRVAYDGLRAFVLRASPGRIDAVGKAYAAGKLSIGEVASILGLGPADALVELEARGHCRAPEDLGLSDEARAALYRRLRDDREGRGGEPEFSAAHVARDAIASERIEGVDARPWLRPRQA